MNIIDNHEQIMRNQTFDELWNFSYPQYYAMTVFNTASKLVNDFVHEFHEFVIFNILWGFPNIGSPHLLSPNWKMNSSDVEIRINVMEARDYVEWNL